jgi:hypothetical protein
MTFPEDGTQIEAYLLQEIPTKTLKEQTLTSPIKTLKTSQEDTFADSQIQGQHPKE